MQFWIVFTLVIGGVVAICAAWWGLRWLLDKVDWFDDPTIAAVVILFILLSAAFIAAIAVSPDNEKGRCGPGTHLIVDRIWTGKSYVTDEVCVVDLPA